MNSLTSRTKPISQIVKPTSKTLYISLFSTSSSSSSGAPPLSPHNNPFSNRRHEEESRSVRVSVWWDIENCGVPNGINVFKIAHSITSAVRANGIKGPVQITAFGDIFCLNRANQEALSSTGVNLIHIPNGGKNSADRSLLVDLMYWVSQNPPPAHIFLISSDRDFAGILHKLRMSNYNILLAAREAKLSSGVLYSSASIMWYWNELVKGENLPGKHFNQPPDGPFNSWYGHYRGPLEDPFAIFEQQKYSETEDSSNPEVSAVTKRRPIPVAVLSKLRRIVSSHPEGLNICELRDQLIKNKVLIDKDFYGHKKFSRFLMALPRIVEVETQTDGKFFLRPVLNTSPQLVESNDVSGKAMTMNDNRDVQILSKANDVSGKSPTVNGNRDVHVISKANIKTPTITRMVGVDDKSNEETPDKKMDEKEDTFIVEEKLAEETCEKKVLDDCLSENDVVSVKNSIGKEASNVEMVENSMIPTKEHDSKHEIGFFKKIWTKLFRGSIEAEKMGNDGLEGLNASSVIPEKSNSEQMQSISSNQNEIREPEHTSSDTGLNLVAKVDMNEKSEDSQGLIAKIIDWCKFWRNETTIEKPNEIPNEEPSPVEEDTRKVDDAQDSEKLDNDASPPKKHELFTKDSFWTALRSFFKTHRGSDIVLKSLSREQIAERLQKEGPLFLQPLNAMDIHHLVDLLLTEKKWIKEFPTKHPRFKLVSLYEGTSTPSQSHSPTGLSSIFLNSPLHDNSQLRVSSIVPKKPSEKSRTDILSDCQKLLDEVLSQNPDGFNISLFKKQFLEKYGYAVDHQKLGYPKLVNLLQMMPGVKVESTRVFPDSVVYAPGIQSLGDKEKSTGSDSEMSDSWEELGPIEKSNLNKEAGEYESTVSDDDELSDTEKEEGSTSSIPVKVEDEIKSRGDEEDSSLLQILDSWYTTKDDTDPSENGSDPEALTGSSEDEPNLSGKNVAGVKGEAGSTVNNGWKQKPSQKRYTFVAEGSEAKKGKLIDGILGSLKKNGEARVQS